MCDFIAARNIDFDRAGRIPLGRNVFSVKDRTIIQNQRDIFNGDITIQLFFHHIIGLKIHNIKYNTEKEVLNKRKDSESSETGQNEGWYKIKIVLLYHILVFFFLFQFYLVEFVSTT